MKYELVVSGSVPVPARSLAHLVKGLVKCTDAECARHIHSGLVKVNGRVRTQTHFQVTPGDRIEVEYTPLAHIQNKRSSASRSPLQIYYEDDDLILVEKPAGLLTVPTKHREKSNLQAIVTKYLQKRVERAQGYCVQRLDRGVSGVLVFAKSLDMAERLRDQFALRKPQRKYIAVVAGHLKVASGTFSSHLATDADLNQYSTRDPDQGKLAVTHYQVIRSWNSATWVEVQLETGRRNQIRVHFAEAGHPVLGDPRYQRQLAVHPLWPYDRLALHAESLSITHPRTGVPVAVQSSWPEEFRTFQRKIQKREDG